MKLMRLHILGDPIAINPAFVVVVEPVGGSDADTTGERNTLLEVLVGDRVRTLVVDEQYGEVLSAFLTAANG